MRISFKPHELDNSENVEQINGKHCKQEPKVEPAATTVKGPQKTVTRKVAEVIATTSAESTLLISSVVSLSDPNAMCSSADVIVLSSDEE